MAASAASVVSRIPTFDIADVFASTTWDEKKLALATAALRRHSESAFSDVFEDAMACWVLHFLVLAASAKKLGGNAGGLITGPLTSLRSGEESASFLPASAGNLSPADKLFLRTTPGQQYLDYRDSRAAAHPFLTSME